MANMGTLGTTEAQIDVLEQAERFAREKSSIADVRRLIADDLGYSPDIWAEIGALGWLGIAVPEAYGGLGLSLTEAVPIAEQMGRYLLHSPFTATTLAGQLLLLGGTEAQKQHWLPQLCEGRAASFAVSEDNGDWDLGNITASAAGEAGGIRLSGEKQFVLDLASANFVIVSAKQDGVMQLYLVDMVDVPVAAMRREGLIDETKRSFALDLSQIPPASVQAMNPQAAQAALAHLHLAANLLGAAEMTGAAQACIDYTLDYLKTRTQFGKPIGAFQALKHPAVDAYVEYENARSLLYAAAFSFGRQGEGEIATRMAKAQAGSALSFAADRSIQFHGGFGFTYDCDAQLYRRRAIFLCSQFGDAAYHRAKLADLLF